MRIGRLYRVDRHPFRHFFRYCGLAIAGFLLAIIAIIPIRLALVVQQVPLPQAIVAVGDDLKVQHIKTLVDRFPGLEIWMNGADSQLDLSDLSIDLVHQNFSTDAIDSLTSLVATFNAESIQHVYLLATEEEMPRVSAIAFLVFGSESIVFTPLLYVPLEWGRSPSIPEQINEWGMDLGRSFWWMMTR
jgi:hypothetical protein